jgi:hypothetical protein
MAGRLCEFRVLAMGSDNLLEVLKLNVEFSRNFRIPQSGQVPISPLGGAMETCQLAPDTTRLRCRLFWVQCGAQLH